MFTNLAIERGPHIVGSMVTSHGRFYGIVLPATMANQPDTLQTKTNS